MPNICLATLMVRGYKDNVDEFIKILQADYSYMDYNDPTKYIVDRSKFTHIPHFFRVFEAFADYEYMPSGVYKSVSINIECAWSVYVCLFDGPLSYYNTFQKEHFNNHFGTHILHESKRLQLEIEIWSYESGMSFQEHYKICSGILVKDEDFNFNTYWLNEMNFDEFKQTPLAAKYPLVNSEDKYKTFAKQHEYIEDCQEEEYDFLQDDEPIYLANIVMVKKTDV